MKELDDPLLTFYMTVKNGMPFLAGAIDSIRSQTYKNIEAVIVDDGSSDGTIDYLKELEKRDPRFRIVITNGVGRGKALNIALGVAKGRYVANLDADDCAHPQRAEVQVKLLEESGMDFLAANCDIVFDGAHPFWNPIKDVGDLEVKNVTRLLFRSNPINHSAATLRRGVIANVGGYDESRLSQFDYDLWIRLAESGVQLFRYEQSLGCKRIHNNQSFENKRRLKYLFSSVWLQCEAISRLGGGFYYYLYPISRFFYGLLPQKLRSTIRR